MKAAERPEKHPLWRSVRVGIPVAVAVHIHVWMLASVHVVMHVCVRVRRTRGGARRGYGRRVRVRVGVCVLSGTAASAHQSYHQKSCESCSSSHLFLLCQKMSCRGPKGPDLWGRLTDACVRVAALPELQRSLPLFVVGPRRTCSAVILV